MRSSLFLKKNLPLSKRISSGAHREAIAPRAQRSLCLNLANCRNARTNYHLTSQQSVPFFVPALSRLRPPASPSKVGSTSVFDLLQSRRSMSPRESVHGRSNPPIPSSFHSLSHLSLSFSLCLSSGEIPRWSTVQNGLFDVDYPEIHGSYDRARPSYGDIRRCP